MQAFDACLKPLLVHEGGNDDDPQDPGGRTSRGITQSEYDVWRVKQGLPKRDVWTADDAEVRLIYLHDYWTVLGCVELPAGVDYAVFDFGVNSGVSKAAKYLQAIVGTTQDGVIGPKTLHAAQTAGAARTTILLCFNRLEYVRGLGSLWVKYGNGWETRIVEVLALAMRMQLTSP